jgi:predicted dehydrogenase
MTRCALVGCGYIAQDIHMHALRGIPGLTVEAVCDSDPARLEAFGNTWGIQHRYRTQDELLAKHHNLDFISISTPGFTHYALCRQAIEAGQNVFLEKPAALSLADTIELDRRGRDAGVAICVGHSYRFRDAVLVAREAQRNGVLGDIYQVNCVHHSGSLFDLPSTWSWEERRNKVLLYEMSIHFLDLAVWFAGPVRNVVGFKKHVDTSVGITKSIYAMLEHESGAVGIVDLQVFASAEYSRFDVHGRGSAASMSFYPEYCRVGRGYVGPIQDLSSAASRIRAVLAATVQQKIRRRGVPRRAIPHFRLLRQFVWHLRDHSVPNPVPIESVLPTMQLLDTLGAHTYDD